MIGSDNKNVYKVLAISRISPTIIVQIYQQTLSTARTKVLIIFREINFFDYYFKNKYF